MEKEDVAASSTIKTLHSFIDKEGLLKMGGRPQQFMINYQTIHRMILPSNHHFTQLFVSSEHIRLHSAGPQHLIEFRREKHLIPRVRNLVKTVIRKCLNCY